MSVEKVRAAIVGCGAVSEIYLSNLSSRFSILDLAACSDRNRWKRDEKAAKYNIRSMSIAEVMEDPGIELIVDLTSPAGHYEINKMALEHGKHVFSEKMLAVRLSEADELLKISEEKGLRLSAAPDTFLGGSIQTAAYLIDRGLIGEPLSAVVSLNKNFGVYGDILPHLNREGGSLPFDSGCYYLTALASLFGPVKELSAYGNIHTPERVSERIDREWFGQKTVISDYTIMTAILKYSCGILASVHFNSESALKNSPVLTVYGTEGILFMGDPDKFDSPVYLSRNGTDRQLFPFTHGYTQNARGIGAAEMAWSIRRGREHRASKEMAFHVLEQIHGMQVSAGSGERYVLSSTFSVPARLPSGYISSGPMSPLEESALL